MPYVSLPCTSFHWLRTTDSGRGAVTWLVFCTLIRIPARWSHGPMEGLVSQALMAKDLAQHAGDMVILNNSAGAVAQNRRKLPWNRCDMPFTQLNNSN